MSVRKPYVAGKFYPSSKSEIIQMFESLHSKEKDNIDYEISKYEIIGGVIPHAGYIYSGKEAIHFFEILSKSKNKYDTIVIVTPNHTGVGEFISIDGNDKWDSPMGSVDIDKDMEEYLNKEGKIPYSKTAQQYEHSGEVMIPFLKQYLPYDFKIMPVNMLLQNYDNAKIIAKGVFEYGIKTGKKILFIASSDFSHYLSASKAERLDVPIIEKIVEGKSQEIYDEINDKDLSICGYGPIMALLEYSKLVGTTTIKLLRYGNSGEVFQEYDRVVSYASIVVYNESKE